MIKSSSGRLRPFWLSLAAISFVAAAGVFQAAAQYAAAYYEIAR
jgi:hypothetical protein